MLRGQHASRFITMNFRSFVKWRKSGERIIKGTIAADGE